MRRWRLPDPATVAGLFVVWAVAWSVSPGRVAEDTKNDLYVDAWGFLARSMHFWDPQVTWGGPANQSYGYLFPMGPFFALGSELMPVWVVQRLWWSTLLTAGLLGTAGLLRALDVGTSRTRLVGALGYVLAPRVVSSIAGLSAEILPQLLAPLVVWPLVAASRGRIPAGRAAALSGVAALCCGGVNATATVFALAPAGLWLVTRHRWWQSRLTWAWTGAVLCATAWWLGPLLLMARYSPPFLDWIENAQAVTGPIGMLDVIRGTTHWLGHIVTPGGVWWPAGYELVSRPSLIILTTIVAAVGLCGLALALPERRWVWSCFVVGGVALTIAHRGPLDSPFVGEAQALLDGPLAPLRNIHKADLLVRLPLAIGLSHALGRVAGWKPKRDWHRPAVLAVAITAVIAAAAPAFTGAVAVRGTFEAMPRHWVEAGRWLDSQQAGQALLLPAANFGEYQWGRTIDEPLRPLTKTAYAVRDAVPFAPAGTIRLLDEIERRLQTGRSIDGGVEILLRAGVTHLVVRNDLATGESGQPPVALARSSVRATPGISYTKGFGSSFLNAAGQRVSPVEIYELRGRAASPLEVWDASDVVSASGASEDLAALADASLLTGPVVFDGDATSELQPATRIETDGYRARERWFGAPRGQDLTNTLTAEAARGVADYLPWPDEALRSAVRFEGVRGVTASSSMGEELSFSGLRPARRPFAAVDGDRRTAWATMWDPRPSLRIDLPSAQELGHVTITALGASDALGDRVSPATRVRVRTDAGSVTVALGASPSRVRLPAGPTTAVSLDIMETRDDEPGNVITGLAEVALPGVTPREVIATGASTSGSPSAPLAMVFGSGLDGRDGCTTDLDEFVCLGGETVTREQTGAMVRTTGPVGGGSWSVSGTLAPGSVPNESLLGSPGVTVSASSVRSGAPHASPQAVVDGDARTAWSPALDDETPELTLGFAEDVTVTTLRFHSRRDWAAQSAPAVVVEIGGKEVTRRIQKDGVVSIPATTGRQLKLRIVGVPGAGFSPAAALELEAVVVDGHMFRPPSSAVVAPCGQGPRLVVDGKVVPTRADVERDAVFGVGSATWSACRQVDLRDEASHRVEVQPWQGFTVDTAVLQRGQVHSAGTPRSVDADRSGAAWSGHLPAADTPRLLVMSQNASAGWEARLGGEPLAGQVVDGRRQGFIVPAGRGGELEVSFPADTAHRFLLAGGLGLALLLVVACLASLRREGEGALEPGGGSAPGAWTLRPILLTGAGAVGVGALVAGPFGAVAAAVGAAVALTIPVRTRALAVAATVALCGLALAVLAPGSLPAPAIEGTVRLALVAVVALAACAPYAPTVGKPTGHES